MKSVFLLVLIPFFAMGAETPKKSQLNTQVFEKESDSESFTAVVKVVREIQGEIQVFFEGRQGYYTLANEGLQEKLARSQTKRQPVQVEVQISSRQILRVETATRD